MTQQEFHSWREFYRLFPFDDRHRYHRPAAAIATAGGMKFDKVLEALSPEPIPPGLSAADWTTMKTFGVRPKG